MVALRVLVSAGHIRLDALFLSSLVVQRFGLTIG